MTLETSVTLQKGGMRRVIRFYPYQDDDAVFYAGLNNREPEALRISIDHDHDHLNIHINREQAQTIVDGLTKALRPETTEKGA